MIISAYFYLLDSKLFYMEAIITGNIFFYKNKRNERKESRPSHRSMDIIMNNLLTLAKALRIVRFLLGQVLYINPSS